MVLYVKQTKPIMYSGIAFGDVFSYVHSLFFPPLLFIPFLLLQTHVCCLCILSISFYYMPLISNSTIFLYPL